MDDLSLVGNQRNNISEMNISASLSFSVISPVIMQLVCITHFLLFVKLFLFKAALSPRDVPFIDVDFTGILHICKFTILYTVIMCSC